ncbi:MAG TPA: hypothetical protein VEN99_09150, partial [Acidimicrobiia bacterium]|nr:hypothetical protein [Acidimicrobiia bacterium]
MRHVRGGPRGLLAAGWFAALAALPALTGVLLALLGFLGATAPAAAASARPRQVVLAAVPGVTWEDVAAGKAPVLRSLGERWSMAALSIRTAVSPTDAVSAMTTIGAGNRARGRTAADNAGLHFGAVPGALGESLSDHGLRAVALGDPRGLLALGRTDAVAGVPDVAVEAGLSDAALASLAGRLDLSRDTLVVVSPYRVPPGPDRLMVAVVAGVGATPGGWITSATTHRNGIVSLPDIAPGILQLFGIAAPRSMTGQAFHTVPAHGDRLRTLTGLEAAAVSYSKRVGPFTFALALAGVAVFAAGWYTLRSGARGASVTASVAPGGWSGFCSLSEQFSDRVVRPSVVVAAGLLVAAVPLACLAQAAAGAERWAAPPAFVFLVAVALAVAGIALAGPWRRRQAGPAAFVAAATVLAIAADLVTGSRGQLTSLIGYTPIEGGRFYGLSAVSFAILATYVVALTGMLAGAMPRWSVPIVAAVAVVTVGLAGAPMLGAKFGSILTLVPAFGLLALLASGRRLSLRALAALVAGAAVVALGIGAADALRPAQSQSHIGRFVGALLGGGGGTGPVGEVIQRKLDANLGIFVRAPYALLAPAALVFVALVALRPARVIEA